MSKVPVVVISIASRTRNPKSVTVGKFKVTEFVPSYSLSLATIPEITIGFAVILTLGDVD